MSIQYVGAGTAHFEHSTNVPAPTLPSGLQVGDIMVMVHASPVAQTVALATGWTRFVNFGGSNNLHIWKRNYVGGDSAPVFTNSGDNLKMARIFAWRESTGGAIDVNTVGADSGGTAANITVTGCNLLEDEILVVVGMREDDWTGAGLLSGDGLTFNEIWDQSLDSTTDGGMAVNDTAPSTSDITPVANKTFTITGGSSADYRGVMFTVQSTIVDFIPRIMVM